jgi:hypothetical protein
MARSSHNDYRTPCEREAKKGPLQRAVFRSMNDSSFIGFELENRYNFTPRLSLTLLGMNYPALF